MKKRKNYAGILLPVLMGIALGLAMAAMIEDDADILQMLLGLLVVLASLVLQTAIHEAGHLVGGLLSGYRFTSFRIFDLMLVKDAGGKLRLRRLVIAGTDGQCLLSPPDPVEGKMPVVLYNLGGVMMNVLSALVAAGVFALLPEKGFWGRALLLFALTGLFLALLNGIPLRTGTVDNDGRNTLSLRRDPAAMYAFWLQMKANAMLAEGRRLRDMPEAWFYMPDDEAMKSGLVAAQGVLVCNRLMDQHRFAETDRLMAHMLEQDGMVALHRCLLICDRMYVEMISENRREVIESMRTKEQVALMKKMKRFPSILRTAYAYALLCQENEEQGADFLAEFDRVARSYPYPADIQSERELMELARKKTA